MGQSQNSKEKSKEYAANFHDKKLDDNIIDYSSYKGIRSETDSFNIMVATNENTDCHSEVQHLESMDLVETIFTWKGQGSEIFVTGSFSSWKQWFTLEKLGDSFNTKLLLSKEKHSFKFIVDKQWVCSSLYQSQFDDKGNLNNFIDLTKSTEEEVQSNAKKYRSKKLIARDLKVSHTSYSVWMPDRSYLNSKTPVIPYNYLEEFSISSLSEQNMKGKKQYVYKDIRPNFNKYSICNASSCPISSGPLVNM